MKPFDSGLYEVRTTNVDCCVCDPHGNVIFEHLSRTAAEDLVFSLNKAHTERMLEKRLDELDERQK